MLGSLSLVEIDPNIQGIGAIASPKLWPTGCADQHYIVCVSGSQSAATHLNSGVDTRDTLSWECQNVRGRNINKSVSETAVNCKLSLRQFIEEL